MKKIIFLGYMVKPSEADKLSGISIAGNKMQWNIIKNIAKQEEYVVDCVTLVPRATFPKDKKIFQYRKINSIEKINKMIYVRYLNLPFFKQITQIISVYIESKKLIHDDNVIIMCFNLFPQIGIPMRLLKRKYKNCTNVCILADLPIDDNTDRGIFSCFFRRLFDNSTKKSIKKCDKFIILNKYVANIFLHNKPYIVIEGGLDKDEIKEKTNKKMKKIKKNIVFSGALTEYNGIKNLIEAMDLLSVKDIYLDIYGGGYLEEQVKRATLNNPNISYFGKIPNDEMLKKQSEAWLLINPRRTNDFIAKVTFPSKIFEYMISGTPILSTKLNGFTDEYLDKLFFCKSDSAQDLADEIMKLNKLPEEELNKMSQEAYNFVCEKKTWDIQCKKIINFLKGINGD